MGSRNTIRFKVFRWIWRNGNKVSRWAGRKMVAILTKNEGNFE